MSNSNKSKIALALKHIIRVILLEYPLRNEIFNLHTLTQSLADIIWKALSNCDLYTPERLNTLLIFCENKLIRGAIFPNTYLQLTFEIVEILEGYSRLKNTNSNLTKEFFFIN